jgi:hypothetical protein
MGESTVRPILDTVASRVSFIHTSAGFVVTKMVPSLCVTSCPVQIRTAKEGGNGEEGFGRVNDEGEGGGRGRRVLRRSGSGRRGEEASPGRNLKVSLLLHLNILKKGLF